MNENDQAMTIKKVAGFLNISNQMVYNLVKDGSLKAFKIGSASRIMYSDLRGYIEKQKEEFAMNHVEPHPDENDFTVSNLSLMKGEFKISDVNFSLPRGKIMSLLGPSGSGKTLLLKAIAGLTPVESGTIFMGKTQLNELLPYERKVGFVFEDYALFPHMNAGKNIEFPSKLRRNIKNDISSETKHQVDELDIDASYLERLPCELPEGMKPLVAIAREVNHEFEMFLMDEPMSRLDADHHLHMRVFIQKIVHDMNKTTLISFNDPEDALVLSDFIGVIDKGQLLQYGETWEVYHHPASLIVLEMMSSLGINALQVEIENGYTIPFNIQAAIADGIYTMAFRPEEVKLAANGIQVKIRSSQFFDGKQSLMLCTFENGHTKQELQLLLPKDTQGGVSFVPLKPHFFPIKK